MDNRTKSPGRQKVHNPYLFFEYILKKNGKNYKYLSNVLNVSISAVSDKINGWSDFTLEEITIICNCLGCSSDVFIEKVTL